MRNENMIEPLTPQCVQTRDSGCFRKDVEKGKQKCEKQCELCKRLELEYSFKN